MRERLAAAVLALALLGGCSRVDTAQPAGGGRHAWTEPGHLRIGSPQEPDSLNKLFANNDSADQIANLISEPLFRYDPDGNLIPGAATAVPSYGNGGISRDGRTITLHLRPGMTWSDGAPYDAHDVVFTYRAIVDPRNNTRLRTGWDDIASFTAPDAHTVVVRMKHVNGGILGIFAIGGAGYPPLPAHLLANEPDLNRAAYNAHPISSGPFVLRTWNHGASLEFVANDRYWRGRPKLDRLTWRVIPNADTLFNALRTHEVDLVDPVTEGQIGQLPQLQGVRVEKRLIANWRRLIFNCRRPVLADRRVRLAIAEAIDWDGMNRTIYHGYNQRQFSDVFPTSWAAPHDIAPYPFDPAGAKRLLDAAGWILGADDVRHKDGAPLAMTISSTTTVQTNAQAELQMQQQLAAVGIRLEIKNYQSSLLFAQDGPLYGGRFDLEFSIDTNGPDPDNEGLWSGAYLPPKGANTTFLADPEITRLSHAATLTFDHAKRAALYDAEERRIHELVPVVFLYWQNAYIAHNDDLKGFRPASFISDLWNGWELSI